MKKNIISLILCVFLILPNLAYAVDDFDDGELGASLLADYETGDILYSKNLTKRIEVASITKIMTYLVAMDEISKGNVNLKDKVTISEKAAKRGGSSFKLKTGEVHTLEMLLQSSMVASANDSCIAIAEHIAGSEKAFIKMMNNKAKELKLDKSFFVSVNGFPEEGTHNTMSVEDILKLTSHTIKEYPEILKTTSKKTLVDKERGFEFTNTNPLLGQVSGISGFKTGYADLAGYCLVSTKESKNSRLISIVMGAGSKGIRAAKSKELLEGNIISKFKREKILDKDIEVDTVIIPDSANGKVEVYPEDDMYGMTQDGQDISKDINVYNYLEFPIKKGDPVGEVTLEYGGNIKKINLVAQEDIKEDGFINVVLLTFRSFFTKFF